MNKLTAEKCRKEIEWVKSSHEEGMVTELTLLLLQALEIALPILEQQERGEGEGGWIEWGGGGCPAPNASLVEIELRDGMKTYGPPDDFSWCHSELWNDIIAYRIIPERATNQNGEQ